MNSIKNLLILASLFVLSYGSFAQDKKSPARDIADYKIISSNNSYIEIEFYPKYKSTSTDFENAIYNSSLFGEPNLGFRNFNFFLPSSSNNRVEVLDFKYEDLFNVDVKPVPTPNKSSNNLEIVNEFIRNEKIFGANSNYPVDFVKFTQSGAVRNKYFGYVKVYPVVFNPVSKTARKFSYIRFRVIFGGNPVINNKPLGYEEKIFFNNLALNYREAENWSTKEFNNLKSNPIVQNSVFANNDLYRIEVHESGMYKIDKNFLIQAGINTSNINPKKIRIFGNGGEVLPYNNSVVTPTDLVENRIYVEGENSGTFGDNDFVVFYGVSPNDWKYQYSNRTFTHYLNIYSKSNYYWITIGDASGPDGLRMTAGNSINNGNIPPLDYFVDRSFEEPEVNNLGSTGTLWLSQKISSGEGFTFNKELKGYIPNSDVSLRIRYGNGSTSSAFFKIEDRNSNFSVIRYVPPILAAFSHINLDFYETNYPLLPGKSGIDLRLSLPSSENSPNVYGYLDYYEIQYLRSTSSAVNNVLRFNSPDTLGTVQYQISTFNSSAAPKIFNVSDKLSPSLINPIDYSNGIVKFQDNNFPGILKEYYAIGNNNYLTPVAISQKYPRQNLNGITQGANYIIIAPTEFLEPANRLKSVRMNTGSVNYISTIVVDINQIYNEFGAGIQDPVSVRNFLKYAYSNWQQRPVYVLMFGDGSYDYKNIYNLNIKNFIPAIEKPDDSGNEIASFNSDDFYVDINENFEIPTECRPDFAVGRLCVNNLNEANTVIDKVQQYESSSTNDIWKKKIMYVADDGWTTDPAGNQGQEGQTHNLQCEDVAENHTPRDFEKEKIYIVTYPTVITPQGRRKPGANVDIIKGWNDGRLAINYVGHGSTDLWAHEHIFVRSESIPQLNNKGKYPLVTIASCDLARWDDPFLISAAEQLVFEVNKGAIGVIAATRPVYSAPNAIFNNILWSNFMFVKDSLLNIPIRIGKAFYNVKNQLSTITDNDSKYSLIGDPTLRIDIPNYFTKIDSINGNSDNDTAKIKALQKVRITGRVLKPDSTFWNDYNGDITIKIYDVSKNITFYDFGYPFDFRLDGGTIFIGNAHVVSGKWLIEFVVPKDISYSNGNGKILAYFKNNLTQGSGFSNMFSFNGLDTNAAIDSTGPKITTFMGTRNFRPGDLVNQNTKIIADFYDENGLNLTSTIGHKIEGILNNNENNKIDLTNFYSTTQNYQNGSLEYPLEGLSDGSYNLKIRAWDTYNNVSTASVDFIVKSNNDLSVNNIYNYPNPMRDFTSFVFQHNFDYTLNADIKIYTVSGRLIKEIKQNEIRDKFVKIDWDGKDNDGDYIANGTYIYKVIIKSEDGKYSVNTTGKLAKLK